MRCFRLIPLVCAALTVKVLAAGGPDDLISQGNRAYDLSQRSQIRICADSLDAILRQGAMSDDERSDYAVSLYKLYGNYHYENCDFDSAAMYYQRAQDIIESHPETHFASLSRLLLLRDRAQLHYRLEEYHTAASLLAEADDILEYDRPYEVGGNDWLITKMSYAMCLARIGEFDQAIDIARTEIDAAIDKTGLDYARAQRMYAKIMLLADADSSGALRAYKAYFETQKRYAMQNFSRMDARGRAEYWQSLRPFIADCYRLEDADAAFLYDVTLFSKGLLLQLSRLSGDEAASESALQTLAYTWRDIQRRLDRRSAAVEFIQYEKDGAQRMAAIILHASGTPRFVALAAPSDIETLAGDEINSTSRTGKNALYNNVDLQSKIWTDDLLGELDGVERIYFAPDGYLHRLAIEYMPPTAPFEMYRLTSTRRLMETPSSLSPVAGALLVGGVNYDLDKALGDESRNDAAAYSHYIGKSFPKLSAETDETKIIYSERANPADSLITASMASEFSFRMCAPGYASILVSTHGDFCSSASSPTDIKPEVEDQAMSQNVIAFAGVNTHLSDRAFDPETHFDGILSAKELSEIDLTSCRLFTISACQSARGEISSDGVFGLQRGLKNAGVGAMLLSLWNVNSEATSALMQAFYRHLSHGLTIRQAFDKARADLMVDRLETAEAYEFDPATMSTRTVTITRNKSFNEPQFTHAFILIDALE